MRESDQHLAPAIAPLGGVLFPEPFTAITGANVAQNTKCTIDANQLKQLLYIGAGCDNLSSQSTQTGCLKEAVRKAGASSPNLCSAPNTFPSSAPDRFAPSSEPLDRLLQYPSGMVRDRSGNLSRLRVRSHQGPVKPSSPYPVEIGRKPRNFVTFGRGKSGIFGQMRRL